MARVAHHGKKGRVEINDIQIGGMMDWAYSGSELAMEDDSPMGQEHVTHTPGMVTGGTITFSGNCLLDSDTGQQTLKALYEAKGEITNILLYYDYTGTDHLKLDATLTPASCCTITKYNEVATGKGGLVTISCSILVDGDMVNNSES